MRAIRLLCGFLVALAFIGDVTACANPTKPYGSQPTTTASVPYLPSDDLVGAITSATNGATAVHMVGSVSASGDAIRFDVHLNKTTASGTIVAHGETLP
jgi:hypothetical protein